MRNLNWKIVVLVMLLVANAALAWDANRMLDQADGLLQQVSHERQMMAQSGDR